MIYDDEMSEFDLEVCPANREGKCVNCNKTWLQHAGWACDTYIGPKVFSKLESSQRFLVPIMLASKKIDVSIPLKSEAWINVPPNECPCGIVRADCSYHK